MRLICRVVWNKRHVALEGGEVLTVTKIETVTQLLVTSVDIRTSTITTTAHQTAGEVTSVITSPTVASQVFGLGTPVWETTTTAVATSEDIMDWWTRDIKTIVRTRTEESTTRIWTTTKPLVH